MIRSNQASKPPSFQTSKLKVCGLTRWRDIQFAASHGVDFLGFILAEKSPRYIAPEKAAAFVSRIKEGFPNKKTVMVVTISDIQDIHGLIKIVKPHYLQVHNDMDASLFNKISFENKIKVIRVKETIRNEDLTVFNAAYFLFDTYHHQFSGGTGKAFDWSLIPEGVLEKSFIAGGLTPQNVRKVAAKYHPFAVDMNSGLEIRPGIKSHKAVVRAVFQVRSLTFHQTGYKSI